MNMLAVLLIRTFPLGKSSIFPTSPINAFPVVSKGTTSTESIYGNRSSTAFPALKGVIISCSTETGLL